MAGPELKFIVGAVDNASKVFSNIGRETEKLGASTAKLNAASRLLGAGAIIAFGAASVKAYAEAETQQVKLQEAYRKFPAIANVSIQSMRDLNTAIQAKTGTDDDELAAAEAKLAMYNLTGTQIQQLIPLVNDYAVATGQNVGDAAQTLGKAMMGNARALKALGIDFHATGDRAKDFQTIYEALQGKVGGAGDAFGQTTAGKLQILNKSFSDLQEEVGAQLVPALKALVDVTVPLLRVFGQMPDPIKTGVVWIGAAGAAALVLGPRILMLTASLKTVLPAAGEAAAGLASETAAADAAGTASAGAAGKIGMMSKALGGITIGIGVTVALYEATMKLQDVMGASADKVTGLANAIKSGDAAQRDSALHAAGMASALDNVGNKLLLLGPLFPVAIANMVNASNASKNLAAENDQLAGSTSNMGSSADAASAAINQVDDANRKAFDSAKYLADSAAELKRRLDDLGGSAISVDDATAGLEAAYDAAAKTAGDLAFKGKSATDAVNDNRSALDLSTDAGRKAQDALKGVAEKADTMAEAYSKAGVPASVIAAKTRDARNAFVAAAEKMGLTEGAANRLADAYGLIPDKVRTDATMNAADAILAAAHLKDNLDAIPRTVPVDVIVNAHGTGNIRVIAAGGLATGGAVSGPGTSTSDSIPAMLSNGEYVLRAAAVSKLGLGLLDDLNDNGQLDNHKFSTGGRVYLAGGGTPAQKLANLIRDTGRLNAASGVLQDLIKARNDMASNITGSIAGTGTLGNAFDVRGLPNALSAQAQAVDQLAAAQKGLADANRQVNLAGTPQERATALEAQAKAQADLAKATADKASADRAVAAAQPTAANVLGGMKSKLGSIRQFFKDLVALKRNGLSPHLLKQIADMGPVEGADMAKALLQDTSLIKEIVATDVAIQRESGRLGSYVADDVNNPLITRQRAVVDRAAAAARADAVLVSQVRLSLDGKQVADALVAYKKAMGGRPLGIS